jgi:diguanylate cyclase (GGDEF)-like protein
VDPHTFAPHGRRRRGRVPVPARVEPTDAGRAESDREALLRVATAAAGAHTLDEVLELAAEEALSAVGAASLSVSRWEREEGVLRTLINVGELGPWEERFPENEIYRIDRHPQLERMLRNGEPYFNAVDDPSSDPEGVALLRSLRKESDVAVPIVTEGEAWGEVWASTLPGQARFRALDVQFLQAIAGQLAIAIERAELFSKVSRLAYEDPLTGLSNRRAVEERLDRAANRTAGREKPLTLLLCDVDNLKAINDGRGHEAGDRALRQVAEALVAAAADVPGALVARLAGDEFCVLLDGADLERARGVAETAIRTLADDRDLSVSISCGAASWGPSARSREQLLRAADAAQYAAKRRGGGQFCTAVAGAAQPASLSRRSFRGSVEERVREAAGAVVESLDGELLGRPIVDRLEAVAQPFAVAVNAAAWTISFSPAGSNDVYSICSADDRDSRLQGLRVGLEKEVYPLDEYPATKRMIEAGSGTFLVELSDANADPAERALLEKLGHEAVLGVSAADLEGTYLLEIFADKATAPLAEAQLELRLLARAAIPPRPAGHTPSDRLLRRAQQLELTNKLSARLAGATDQDAILGAAVEELHGTLGYRICAIVRVTEDDMQEVVAEALGTGPGRWEGWRAPLSSGLIGRAITECVPLLTNDVRKEPAYRPTEATLDTLAELDVPITVGDRVWGAITVQEDRTGAFDDDDLRLLLTIADQLGAALRSVALYEQLERAYLGTAEALAAALEAKDLYTASHSHSIVANAESVGRLLGMDDDDLRSLKLGAAFHDIGKLAVPEEILNKRGPLTDEERGIIERHPEAGEMILAPVEFLAPVLPLVRHGHERWDGFGYPDGLARDGIPLGARIIFACDAWDAMTSNRPYRAAMPEAEARAEMRRAAGTQFDPDVVDALLRVLDQE